MDQKSPPEPANPPETSRKGLILLQRLGLRLNHFYDIGASNGRGSWLFSEDFPEARFDLFEPLIDHVPAYRERMDFVLAHRPQCHLHKVALGPECKRALMYVPPDPGGSTALNMGHCAPADWERVEVEMLTVDQAVKAFSLPKPDVIKMDTQGCELAILEGAVNTLPQVQVLVLECWLARAYGPATPLFEEVAAWLREFRFHLWDLGGSWRDTDGTLIAQDCFFLNARSHISRLRAEVPAGRPSVGAGEAAGHQAPSR